MYNERCDTQRKGIKSADKYPKSNIVFGIVRNE